MNQTRIWERGKVKKKGIGRAESNAWDACFVLSGTHMGLNSGWQSVWCFPIFHYQAASTAARHYLLMTEWTTDLMDRWMGSLMNVWQVLCQSGRQSKTQGEGRNHLDSRDTSNVSYPTQNPTCPHCSSNQSNYSVTLGINEAVLLCFRHLYWQAMSLQYQLDLILKNAHRGGQSPLSYTMTDRSNTSGIR